MVYISETYNTNTRDRISAVIEGDHIRYLIWDAEKKVVRYDSTYLTDVLRMLENELSLKKADLAIATPNFHLLPSGLYEDGRDAWYLEQLVDRPADSVVANISLDVIDMRGSYYVPLKLYDDLRKIVPEVRISHFVERYVHLIRPKIFDTRFKGFLVHFLQHSFYVSFIADGKLQFIHQYPFRGAEDVLYYVLATYERFDCNPHQVSLTLSGDIDRESMVYKRLYEYVREVEFLKTNEDILFAGMTFPLKPHQVIALI